MDGMSTQFNSISALHPHVGTKVESFVLNEHAHQVLVQHVVRITPMSRSTKHESGIAARILQHNVLSTRVVIQKVSDIVDAIKDHNPTVVGHPVFAHFRQCKLWQCVGIDFGGNLCRRGGHFRVHTLPVMVRGEGGGHRRHKVLYGLEHFCAI